MKSNAEKVEKYLYRCSMDPTLKNSTLLRDFFSPQREGDLIKEKSHVSTSPSSVSHDPQDTPASYSPQLNTTTLEDSIVDSRIDVGKVWVPSPHPSIISLPNSIKTNSREDEAEEDEDDNDSLIDRLSRHSARSQQHYQDTFPLDHLEMIKVLGKGCMGKVSCNPTIINSLLNSNDHCLGCIGKIANNQGAVCFKIHCQGACD